MNTMNKEENSTRLLAASERTVKPLQLTRFDGAECLIFWTDQHQKDQVPKQTMDIQMVVLMVHSSFWSIQAKYALPVTNAHQWKSVNYAIKIYFILEKGSNGILNIQTPKRSKHLDWFILTSHKM